MGLRGFVHFVLNEFVLLLEDDVILLVFGFNCGSCFCRRVGFVVCLVTV